MFATWYEGLAPIPAGRAPQAAALAQLLRVRDAVTRVLEPMRADGRIGASLQAEVTVHSDDAGLGGFDDEARFLFITSGATFVPATGRPEDAVAVEGLPAWVSARATTQAKCVRCWHHTSDVGAHADDPELCGRCVANVNGAGETRRYF